MTADTGEPRATSPHRPPELNEGLYLYGVTRSRSWRGRAVDDTLSRVRYRDLEAIVRTVPYRLPELGDGSLSEHQRLVESLLRKGTVVPAPFGIVFAGRRSVIRFLEDQYIALDEGLTFLDGHFELRLHIAGDDDDAQGLLDLARHIYAELRRFARAAIPLPAGGDRVLSAAFLVDRNGWIEFVERTSDMETAHPPLTFDITGPWPPYDFVRIT